MNDNDYTEMLNQLKDTLKTQNSRDDAIWRANIAAIKAEQALEDAEWRANIAAIKAEQALEDAEWRANIAAKKVEQARYDAMIRDAQLGEKTDISYRERFANLEADEMFRQAQARLHEGYAETDAIVREAQARLQESHAISDAMARDAYLKSRTEILCLDAMVIRSLKERRLLIEEITKPTGPVKDLDDIRFQ